MSAEALAAALTAIGDLTLEETLTLKSVLETKISAKSAMLKRGDVVTYIGKSAPRFGFVKNVTKLVVTEVRRTRIVVRLADNNHATPVITYPNSVAPTGETVNLGVAPPKFRRRRRSPFYED